MIPRLLALFLGIASALGLASCVNPEPRPDHTVDPAAPTRYGSDDLSSESGMGGMVPGETQFQEGGNTEGWVTEGGGDAPEGDPDAPTLPPDPSSVDLGGADPDPAPSRPAQPDPNGDHPRGIPVPSMPGHVYSPHSRDAGIVDVSEWPSGTLVKDPFKPDQDLWFFVP